jgi:hypothetical protein
MSSGAVLAFQIAAVALVAALIVAVIAAAARARASGGEGHGTTVRDVERALGASTVTTYERASAGMADPSPEGKAERCAICLSEYAGGDELVRVVPACGHFFHAECGVEGWLRARQTCPLCRGRLWPLPQRQCPPTPSRYGGDAGAAAKASTAPPV